ncbi:MAG: mannose-6-phosphate isomerase, class I [Actinomycetota bacterium]|nr:mannose-6-phosphate isomerase, class I [Actinomycetota bacterium]
MPVPPVVMGLDGVLKRYEWGSPDGIPGLLGTRPDGEPVAELWFGAHPQDPSPVPYLSQTLDEVIAANPIGMLGIRTAAKFGDRLPFLLKILAPAKPLSIQVHPNLEQAWAGFLAENAAGMPRESADRNYRDANHKPELLCALTPFEALCGLRPVAGTLRLFDALEVSELGAIRTLLEGEDGLRAAVTHLLTIRDPQPLVAAVASGCRRLGGSGSGEWVNLARAVALAESEFPGDVGVVVALLLNHVILDPGEAVYVGAGTLHCYLRGMGVEVMANSDNVLRGGLTPKHIDVPELLKITDFRPLGDPRCSGRRVDGLREFRPPIPDFRLSILDLDSTAGQFTARGGEPHILLCARGAVEIEVEAGGVLGVEAGAVLTLSTGHAAFIPAGAHSFELRGAGRVFLATVR